MTSSIRQSKLILCSFLFLVSLVARDAHALDCADIRTIEKQFGYDGALSLYLGCDPPTAAKIALVFDDLPDVFKLTFSTDFFLEDVTDRINEKRFLDQVSTFNKIEQGIIFIGTEIYDSNVAPNIQNFVSNSVRSDDDLLQLFGAITASLYPGMFLAKQVEMFRILRKSRDIPFVAKLLADFYLEGSVVARDLRKGLSLLEESADKHPWLAQTLAYLYKENQWGIQPDADKYLFYQQQGLNAGWIYSIASEIEDLWYGSDSVADWEEWARRHQVLAFYGHPFSQYNLGHAYKEGQGVRKNIDKAKYWLISAADQGDTNALEALSEIAFYQWETDTEIKYQSIRASKGFLDAYYQLSKLVYVRITNLTKRNLALSYVKQRCLGNSLLEDNQKDCDDLPGEERSFVNNSSIDKIVLSPGQLRLANKALAKGQATNYALFLANENYLNYGDLTTPISDGSALSEILRDKFGYNVISIRNSDRKEMLQAIYALKETVTIDDNLIIYYGGHGTLDKRTGVGYWLPSDATVDFPADWISTDEIVNALSHIEARHLLLIADACFSGTFSQASTRGFVSDNREAEGSTSRLVMTSGSIEPVLDVGINPDHSVFAGALIDVLGNLKHPMTSEDIFLQIKPKILSYAEQTPGFFPLRNLGHIGGSLLFEPAL